MAAKPVGSVHILNQLWFLPADGSYWINKGGDDGFELLYVASQVDDIAALKASIEYVDEQHEINANAISVLETEKADKDNITETITVSYADLDSSTHTIFTNINYANKIVRIDNIVAGSINNTFLNVEFDSSGSIDFTDLGITPDASFQVSIIGSMGDLSNFASETEFSIVKQKVDGAISLSRQLSDNVNDFENGYYAANGSPVAGTNRLRTKMRPIKGNTTYTIYGFFTDGAIGTTSRVVIRDANGDFILNVLNAGDDLSPVTFTTPSQDGLTVGFSIANVLNIDPLDNPFLTTFMWVEGAEIIPFIEYGVSIIDATKLNYNVIEEDAAINSVLADVTIASKNEVDTHTDVISGQLVASNGHPSPGQANWIMTIQFTVKPSTKYFISGFGPASSTAARVVCKKSFLETEPSYGQIIPANGADLSFVEVTTASDEVVMMCTVANVTGIGTGTNPSNNQYTDSFQVEEASIGQTEPSQYIRKGHSILNISPSDLSGYNTNEIVVVKPTVDLINIYYHSGESAANDIWVKLTFFHQVDAVKYIDVWRLDRAYRCQRTGDISFTDLLQVIETGMWENAIYTSGGGYSDALGGLHGCELINELTILADSEPILTSDTGEWKCSRLFIASSSYFKTSNGTGNIGLTLKTWDITNEEIITTNDISWLGTLTVLQNSFMSMMSVSREAGAVNITHTAMRNDEWKKYDVSESGFSNPLINVINNPKDKNIMIWGDVVIAQMEVIERTPTLSNAGMWVQNTIYNKLYAPFGSAVLNNGDRWIIKTRYKLQVK